MREAAPPARVLRVHLQAASLLTVSMSSINCVLNSDMLHRQGTGVTLNLRVGCVSAVDSAVNRIRIVSAVSDVNTLGASVFLLNSACLVKLM